MGKDDHESRLSRLEQNASTTSDGVIEIKKWLEKTSDTMHSNHQEVIQRLTANETIQKATLDYQKSCDTGARNSRAAWSSLAQREPPGGEVRHRERPDSRRNIPAPSRCWRLCSGVSTHDRPRNRLRRGHPRPHHRRRGPRRGGSGHDRRRQCDSEPRSQAPLVGQFRQRGLPEALPILVLEPRRPEPSIILNLDSGFSIYNDALAIARKASTGTLADITNGATSYYAKGTPEPKWAFGKDACTS